MVKKLVLFVLVFFIFSSVSSVKAETSSNLEKLDRISDEALQMVKIKRYDDGIALLHSFSDILMETTAKENYISMDELRIVTTAYDEAIKSLSNGNNEHELKLNAVTKLRLVVDAMGSQYQPLWTKLEDRMMTAFSETQKAVDENNPQLFNRELNDLLNQYDLIYYSLQIDVKEETIHKINTRFHYLDQYRPEVFESTASKREIDRLKYDMQEIFENMKEDEADPSLWWVIISTGSIIISTLSYVGWRKYRGGKENMKKGKKLND